MLNFPNIGVFKIIIWLAGNFLWIKIYGEIPVVVKQESGGFIEKAVHTAVKESTVMLLYKITIEGVPS